MSESLELASTIGTWIGAGVGIVALIGIIGPALIWYASTQERQKTLNAIGRDNNNYLSHGYHLGPNIWLFQRVRAPMLKHAKSLRTFDTLPVLDASKVKTIDTETSWILFGSLLEAYGIPLKRGDNLVIKDGATLLPIHPSWILAVGLLGRYSNQMNQSRLSTMGFPKFNIGNSFTPRHPRLARVRRSLDDTVDSTTESTDQDAAYIDTLYGTTGSLEFSMPTTMPNGSPLCTAKFNSRTIREVSVDILDPKDLLLLSLGFLKTSQSHYLCVMHFNGMSEDWSGDRHDDEVPIRRGPDAGMPRIEPYYRGDTLPKPPRFNKVLYPRPPSVYRLQRIEPDQEVLKLGGSFLGTSPIDMFMLMQLSPALAAPILAELSPWTKLPIDSNWVRVSDVDQKGNDTVARFYIERTSAQRLAFGLLILRWHPERYLLPSIIQTGPGGKLFENAAHSLLKNVFRLSQGLEWLSLSPANKQKLSSALGAIQSPLNAGPHARLYAAAKELDEVLGELGSSKEQEFVDQIIAILSITSSEFRSLVYDSLRSLKETATSLVHLEMPSATLKVPKAFGVMQNFYVDWQEMFPGEGRNHETISVSYTVVVLATTRSLVKCQMLLCCPDARPLIRTVVSLGDVVHMT